MDKVLLDPIFNLRTVPPLPAGKSLEDTTTIVTQVFIETARPIILTQDAKKAGDTQANYVYLPTTASISIHGDDVRVSGKLSFPGQNVAIFARVLGAEDDGATPAAISVDGARLTDELAYPKALKKGLSDPKKPGKAKVAAGEAGWLLRDHPEMSGYDGEKANEGLSAGNIWICCHKTSFRGTERKLNISATGGPGGDGQPGQDGADGGRGNNGRPFKQLFITYEAPQNGTRGGDGGNGGTGGKAGQGGKGGSIIFHCIASQPALALNYEGGAPGSPGKGGKLGPRGWGGTGGSGGRLTVVGGRGGASYQQIDSAANGPDGDDGKTGNDGPIADPSQRGSSSISWGQVDSTLLVQMASITQLQMLFERTRADYLVTEPRDYSLRLMAIAPPKGSAVPDLVSTGNNLVVVGLSRDSLRLRIFDASGQIVIDKQEPEMIQNELHFQISMADVLEAGNWVTPEDLHGDWLSLKPRGDGTAPERQGCGSSQMQRKALIDQLSRITGLPSEKFTPLSDYDLTGRGAVAAFLLQMGIRDEAGLKNDVECGRNVLIIEVAGMCGYAGGQGLKDLELVQLALQPTEQNKFVHQRGMLLLRNRLLGTEMVVALKSLFQMSLSDVLRAGGWVAPDQLDEMSVQDQRQILIDQLNRISGLSKEWFNKLADDDLIGNGAVTALLLQTGIRDEAGLKIDANGYRQALKQEISAHMGYSVESLERFDDQDLIYAALKAGSNNKFGDFPEEVSRLRSHIVPDWSDALRAGGWLTQGQLASMPDSEKRQALIDQLNRITHLPKDVLSALTDHDLIGRGIASAFLLQMRLRTEADLQVPTNLEGYRNTLIVETAGRCGYDGGYLQGLNNQQLVRLAVEPTSHFASNNAFLDLCKRFCPSRPVQEQQGIIAAAAEMANYGDVWSGIGDRLDWLTQLLYPATLSYPQERRKEHPEKDLAKAVQASVSAALKSYACNLDYYGKSPRWVPTLSLGTYLDAFKGSIAILKSTEKHYKKYFAAWNDQKTATTHLQNVLATTDNYSKFLSQRIVETRRQKSETEDNIKRYDEERNSLCDSLKKDLSDFGEQVHKAFGLNWNSFFNCLSQLGFANFSEPARLHKGISKAGGFVKAGLVEGGAVVGGYASAGAMIAGPLGQMLKEAGDNIVTDSGESVNKNWLLEQIDVIQGDLNLRTALEERADGFKDPTDSKRLVVEVSKLQELCKQFYKSKDGAARVRNTLGKYIDNITTRNRHIDYYNGLVQELLDLAGELKKIQQRVDVVQGQLTATSNPGLPAMATFVSALYERAKAECLSDLYLASRAYSFWALESYTKFYESLQSPGAITGEQLEAAHGTFTKHIRERLENGFGKVNFTPPREDSEASIGIVVVLSKESHPDFFDDLISENHADFQLEPALFSSTQPVTYLPTTAAWYGTKRPKFESSAPNPFHGRANVRLRKVRVWIVGMETTLHQHTVQIIHQGSERFRRRDNVPYPKAGSEQQAEYVLHDETTIPFSYNSDGLSWDPVKNTFTPGKLFAPGTPGAEDADLGFPQPGADVSKSVYAPIGPFAKWRVVVNPDNNLGLKWDKVQAIVIDFHIFKETFDSNLVRTADAGSSAR